MRIPACRFFFIATCLSLIVICLSTQSKAPVRGEVEGTARIGSYESSIYFKDYDFTVRGFEFDNVTYFFLPSFIQDITLNYRDSELILFGEDGDVLNHPVTGSVENTMAADAGSGEGLAYRKVAFIASENLYTMDITLKGADIREITKVDYSTATIKLISPSGFIDCHTRHALIKGRGNTTWGFEKKPYDIRFPKKLPVAGLTPADRWTLLANQYDPTNLRQRLGFDIADALGMKNVSKSEWIDLYINGDYRGNYLVCHEPSGEPGGYLIESNGTTRRGSKKRYEFEVPSGTRMTLRYPDPPSADDADYITSVTGKVDEAIHNDLPEAQYTFFDRYSFARVFLTDEIALNADIDFSSHFYYTEPGDDVMYAGPLWDYDKAFGYPRPGKRDWTNTILIPDNECLDWQYRLTEDREYYDYVAVTFSQAAESLGTIVHENIDAYCDRIKASSESDRIRWTGDSRENIFADRDNEIRYLKFFLSNRLAYLSEKYHTESPIMPVEVTTGDVHKLSLSMPGGSIRIMDVIDGSLPGQNDLPPLSGSDVWCFDLFGRLEEVEGVIPIYEDLNLVPGVPSYQKKRPLK